ncbi:MipA/OmpV family protein [Marinobacter sp. 71-i]|uniref:MipA/OmpV family protein n=1 Tax=Marinobacter iranensis TaxID=2962607 RepID=A0ABT5YGB0_9GAMM|nr:MipA/OmpV family protein [Marinobacter iranensis]MDF0752709.1 MipA/OmpV family protein [Marinobacter iranensis]
MKKLKIASLAVITILGSTAAYAEERGWGDSSYEQDEEEMGTRNWKDWDVTVGIGGEYGPVSPGVDKTEFEAFPYVDIEYKDRYFLNFEKGLGAYLLRSEDGPEYALGVAVGYAEGRDEADARAELDGLGDIDGAAEFVLFAEGEIGFVEVELEVAKALSGHDGLTAELSAGVDASVTDSLFVGVAPFITYADEKYTQSFYGVSASQAANSATYNQYDADGGFENYGVEVEASYKITRNWSATTSASYTRLLGDAKDSPIVDNKGFFSAGVGLAYTF